MVGEAGIEPATPGLEGRCSIQLSYSPVRAVPWLGLGDKISILGFDSLHYDRPDLLAENGGERAGRNRVGLPP